MSAAVSYYLRRPEPTVPIARSDNLGTTMELSAGTGGTESLARRSKHKEPRPKARLFSLKRGS